MDLIKYLVKQQRITQTTPHTFFILLPWWIFAEMYFNRPFAELYILGRLQGFFSICHCCKLQKRKSAENYGCFLRILI